jgi:hypothetical protein
MFFSLVNRATPDRLYRSNPESKRSSASTPTRFSLPPIVPNYASNEIGEPIILAPFVGDYETQYVKLHQEASKKKFGLIQVRMSKQANFVTLSLTVDKFIQIPCVDYLLQVARLALLFATSWQSFILNYRTASENYIPGQSSPEITEMFQSK